MGTRYETHGWLKVVEQDDVERGCIGGATLSAADIDFAAESVDALVRQICDWFNVTVEHATVDACGEPGRLDVRLTETDEGDTAAADDEERWRQGEQRLWAATYTFRVERVTREVVDLSPLAPDLDSEAGS